MARRYLNSYRAQLGAALTSGATVATLLPGQAAAIAAVLEPGDWMLLTLEGDGVREIVRVDVVSGDTLSPLGRGQEQTTARAWPIGTLVECRVTASSFDGAIGPAGPQGPAGPTGATGAQGPAGPAGNDGATGPQGPVGTTGATGAQGPAGPAGATGAPGATGAQGPAGPSGTDGATGPQGPAGTTGATGATGAQGPSGPAGPQGAQGPAGPVATFRAADLLVSPLHYHTAVVDHVDAAATAGAGVLATFAPNVDHELDDLTDHTLLAECLAGVVRFTIARPGPLVGAFRITYILSSA